MPLKELSKEEQSQLFIQGRGPKTKAVQLTRKDLGRFICIYSRDHKFVVFITWRSLAQNITNLLSQLYFLISQICLSSASQNHN